MMVRTEREGDVLLIIIDNPPINAGSLLVREAILTGIQTLGSDATLTCAVLMGAGENFMAGSDLREFGRPLEDPQLPAVIAAIETCRKPVVAAIDGAALGGGLELALGCDARVASERAVVGLPEVGLGMIPGAGGTQRLPRIVGIAQAIELICTGERVSAARAQHLGVLDRVVRQVQLRHQAVAYARSLGTRKRAVRDLPVPVVAQEDIERAAAFARRKGRHRPQVEAAIEMVKASAVLSFGVALTKEREVFQALRVSHDALALRHQFFAERDIFKYPEFDAVTPKAIKRVTVIGAGTMGTGIAMALLQAGLDVCVIERSEPALQQGLSRIAQYYAERVAAGKMDHTTAAAHKGRLMGDTRWGALRHTDLVIEAVFEDLAVKQSVFRHIDAHVAPGVLMATNTSYLDIDAIAAVTSRPQDVLGLHFFSPAHVMRLLEVVRGTQTSAQAVATGMTLGKRMRKLPVVAQNAFGFIGNRLYAAYRRQCEFMLEEGAYPEEIDRALETFGFAMGPFAVADMSGLDIAWKMRQAQAATRDPQARYVDIADQLCEAGRLGRKTGAGYYRYDPGSNAGVSDPVVHQLIEHSSSQKGLVRRRIEPTEMVRRVLLAMVNEAAQLLGEGVAARPTDIDVVLVNGYGFPRWEGGIVFWARQQHRDTLEKEVDWLCDLSGPGVRRADLLPVIEPTLAGQ